MLANPSSPDGLSRYVASEVINYPNPPDMWSAVLQFSPRPKALSEVERHEVAVSWFEGKGGPVPYLAAELARERSAEFGHCSEVVIGAYVDFLKGVEPK